MKKSIFCVMLCVMLLVSNLAALAVSAEDEENYVDNWVYLEMGAVEYETDTTVAYTAFHIEPSQAGKYTVSCDEQKIGILSYSEFFIPAAPSADTISQNAVVWECTEVGQAIIIAVESGDGAVTITVTREDLVQKEEVQWTIYENQVTPTAFTFTQDAAALKTVDTKNSVADTAVLGADGYYHLNAADGALLFVNLNSPMSFPSMIELGRVKEVVQDEDLTVLSKTDFNEAMAEYTACMDSKTGLYPLTVDLMAVYQRVGNYMGWYGADGYVGGELEDAWMFACQYIDGYTTMGTPEGDLNGDGAADTDDAAALFYYINGVGELANAEDADFNDDGVVNLYDAARLFYAVNGLI